MPVVTKDKTGSDKASEKAMNEKPTEKPEKASKHAANDSHKDDKGHALSADRAKALGLALDSI